MKTFHFEIDNNTHADFKSSCAKEGVAMKDKLVELMRRYNEEEARKNANTKTA